jgi:hypothetical protein
MNQSIYPRGTSVKKTLRPAREIGAAEEDSRADELMGKLAKQAPEPPKEEK